MCGVATEARLDELPIRLAPFSDLSVVTLHHHPKFSAKGHARASHGNLFNKQTKARFVYGTVHVPVQGHSSVESCTQVSNCIMSEGKLTQSMDTAHSALFYCSASLYFQARYLNSFTWLHLIYNQHVPMLGTLLSSNKQPCMANAARRRPHSTNRRSRVWHR